MLLNAKQVEAMLTTNGKGKAAQVGYDLTVCGVNKIIGGTLLKSGTHLNNYIEVLTTTTSQVENVDVTDKEVWILSPGAYSVTFEQGCKLDDKTTAFIRQRSSLLRMGGTVTSGVYDPGFEVEQMGGVMILTDRTVIEKGARIAQIIMHENNSAELYDGQWQGEKDRK
jgi:deoxycytidine triphosphate deaminase